MTEVKRIQKEDRFRKVAQRRARRAIETLRTLRRCANLALYAYTDEERDALLAAVTAEHQALVDAFHHRKPVQAAFTFPPRRKGPLLELEPVEGGG